MAWQVQYYIFVHLVFISHGINVRDPLTSVECQRGKIDHFEAARTASCTCSSNLILNYLQSVNFF